MQNNSLEKMGYIKPIIHDYLPGGPKRMVDINFSKKSYTFWIDDVTQMQEKSMPNMLENLD